MTESVERPQLFWDIYERIDHNQNMLIAITGGTGSGKTWTALRLAEQLSTERGVPFTVDNVCLSVKDLLSLVVNGNLPKGSVILMDESGISANNRNWQSTNNKMLQFLLQTFRHRNIIVLFTSPDLAFVDKASRKLLHLWFETARIDRVKHVNWCIPKWVKVNQSTGDFYFNLPRVYEDGKMIPTCMARVGFKLASKELRDAVDSKLDAYKTEKAKEWLAETESAENSKGENSLTAKQESVLYLNKELSFNTKSIAQVLGITPTATYEHLRIIKRKGHAVLNQDLRDAVPEEIEMARKALNERFSKAEG